MPVSSGCVCVHAHLRSQRFVFFLQLFELLLQGVDGEKSWSGHIVFTGSHAADAKEKTHTRDAGQSVVVSYILYASC